jgi:ABC-2 type transport system ATP-binding protein
MAIIEIQDLSKQFKTVSALKNLSLKVERGEIFGIIGPDGAGKTTFLRILTGVLAPSSGQVNVCNIDVVRSPDLVKSKIGVVPQNFSLYPDLTVEENLNFFRKMYLISEPDFIKRKERLLQITRLSPFLDRRAAQLSGGMQKKLALIACLLHTPELLLLDEPTTGVDPVSRRELWDFLYDLFGQGTTIIVSTPYMDEAERCSRVGFLYHGELLSVDNPSVIRDKYPHKIFEIRTKDNDLIRSLKFPEDLNIIDLRPAGQFMHLITDNIQTDTIKEFLRQHKVQFEMEQVEPTFEDAFISLIRQKQEKRL